MTAQVKQIQEALQSNVNEKNTENSNFPSINEAVENTPFRIIGEPEKGYAITIGQYALTMPKETEEEARQSIENDKWNIITNLIIAIGMLTKEEDKKNN